MHVMTSICKPTGSIRCTLALAASVLVPTWAHAQTVEYYHLDALGSVRAVTNQAGAVIERHDYLPFGEELSAPGTANTRKFTGKERDVETGLDYFGARYYAATTARFTTIDPVYTWRENLVDPQRWNRYAYVRNNPLRFTDPDGRELKLVIFNSSDLSREAVSRIATNIAEKFRDAGVKNVTFDLREGRPSALTTMRYQLLPTPHSHLLEIRPGPEGEPRIRRGEAGHNWGGQSALDIATIRSKSIGQALATGVTNVGTHEVAHDALGHTTGSTNIMRSDGATDPKWLSNVNLRFTPKQSEVLQKKYNKPNER